MRRVVLFIVCFAFFEVFAQEPLKKPLSIEDFNSWHTLSNPIISNDGKWIAFGQAPQKGDGMLIVRSSETDFDTLPRGYNAAFGPENDFMVFSIKQPENTLREAKLAKVKKEDMPGDSLGILLLEERRLLLFPGLKSYKIPEKNAKWMAFSVDPSVQNGDNEKETDKKQTKQEGDDLVLFRVETSDTLVFRNVSEWYYAKEGSAIFFNREVKDSVGTVSSLHVFNCLTGKADALFSETGWLKKAVSDKPGGQFAFLFSQDTIKEKVFSLWLGDLSKMPEKIADGTSRGFPVDWSPSENGEIYFSEDGTKLFFGTAPSPLPMSGDTLLAEEKPVLDIWSWQDLKLQSQQKVEAASEKKRTWLAVYHIELKRSVQLGDSVIRDVSTLQKGNGHISLGYNEIPYLRERSWTGRGNRDFYILDLVSGIKREIADNISYLRISPQGKYVVWYEPSDSSFYARSTDISRLKAIPLSKMIPVAFYDEKHDRPMDPSPYGIAGWSENDRFVYIYDRYDIWRLDPSGERVPVNITRAYGRRNQIRLRYQKTDADLEYIPDEEPVLLSAFNEQNMESGFFSTRFGKVADPELLLMERNHFGGLTKAKNGDRLLWTKESVSDFPDLWSSDLSFSEREKISDANPQQGGYIWPKVQVVEWTSFTGEKLKGLLYLPENLDAGKKYPMLIYFYELSSQNLYRHQHPAPSRSTINKTFYASNGYVVFVPDITYREGYPGQSAYDAIVSGTQYLLNTFPYLDEKRVGLQGQSWGGYQTAWLITRTDIYAAAMAGAPVSNMISAYGGIRWQTGLSRMFQYEQTQSRIGGTLWEKPLHYIENSPLLYAPKVKTPLLMMHNDNDGAVPWYQGIEFFVALRRLDKPVWLLNYNDEPHNLKASSWANRMDLSRRMFQFFNHYLKGEPMPGWMDKGVPALEKGESLGY